MVTNWIPENRQKCKVIKTEEFNDLDSLGVHEFDRNRCYDPKYDLDPNNEGDRSDYVKWAIMNNIPEILIPDVNGKFPYDDIEFKIIMDRYFKKDFSESRDKRFNFYFDAYLEMIKEKRKIYNSDPSDPDVFLTSMQSMVKKTLKKQLVDKKKEEPNEVLLGEIEDKILSHTPQEEIQRKINAFFPRY